MGLFEWMLTFGWCCLFTAGGITWLIRLMVRASMKEKVDGSR